MSGSWLLMLCLDVYMMMTERHGASKKKWSTKDNDIIENQRKDNCFLRTGYIPQTRQWTKTSFCCSSLCEEIYGGSLCVMSFRDPLFKLIYRLLFRYLLKIGCGKVAHRLVHCFSVFSFLEQFKWFQFKLLKELYILLSRYFRFWSILWKSTSWQLYKIW